MAKVQINLCRALKLKNRLASRLSRLDSLIVGHNSTVRDFSEFDVRQLYTRRMLLAEQLVELKVQISEANRPIQKQIFEAAECKSACTMLGRIDTKHGPHAEGFGQNLQEFAAQFRKTDINRETRKIENEIDRLQDELDQFNYQTKISVDEKLLEPDDDFE